MSRRSFLSKHMTVRGADIMFLINLVVIIVSETPTVLPSVSCARSGVSAARAGITFSDTMLPNIRFCKELVVQQPNNCHRLKRYNWSSATRYLLCFSLNKSRHTHIFTQYTTFYIIKKDTNLIYRYLDWWALRVDERATKVKVFITGTG